MIVAGIDVSNERLQVHVEASPWDEGGNSGEARSGRSAAREDRVFSNDWQSFRSLRKWLRMSTLTTFYADLTVCCSHNVMVFA